MFTIFSVNSASQPELGSTSEASEDTLDSADLDENTHGRGTFDYDADPRRYPLLWPSEDAFADWKRTEERKKSIELRYHKKDNPTMQAKKHWLKKITYLCARNLTGGKSKYVRKTDRQMKLASKKIDAGCPARLVIKFYPDREEIRGKYIEEHSHEIADSNLIYTRIPIETRESIAAMLRQGVKPDIVVSAYSAFIHL